MDGYECAGFHFYSNFDSANLCRVEYVGTPENKINSSSFTGKQDIPNVEFNLWTKPDCAGTEFENGNRTWFYFGVKGTVPSALIKFNIVDLNKQAKLYSQGMGPVFRILPGKGHWERIIDKPTFNNEKNVFTLSFKCKAPENVNSVLYLAFTYPYSYADLQSKLALIDNRFSADDDLNSKDDIYYVRERVCDSLEGRRMDLITITSFHGISSERETRLTNLFPDPNTLRPYRFVDKKVIFISARVHPGETPSSFVFNGFLNLLLTRDDTVAIVLRRNYVFKLVPCLNPDGVVNGHYRTDTRGVNLNRVYLNPNVTDHPTISAARALIRYYHYGFEKEDDEREEGLSTEVSHITIDSKKEAWCSKCKALVELQEKSGSCGHCGEFLECNNSFGGDTKNPDASGLFLYVDMHGHASKKGIFMYGNHFDDVDCNVKCMLLPKLMSINNHNFHFTACNFTERNMYLKDKRDGMSKEGSGRVAVFKLTGLVQSYTLECNYNTGRLVNVLPPTIKETAKAIHNVLVPPKYTPHVFEEVGRAIGISILDLINQNPYTRLPHSEYHSLNGLREWLRVRCASGLGDLSKPKVIRHAVSHHSSSMNVAQGKVGGSRSVIVKSRSLNKFGAKKMKQLKKDKLAVAGIVSSTPQPSCSELVTPSTSGRPARTNNLKTSKSLNMRPRVKNQEKHRPNSSQSTVNHIAKNIQNTSAKCKVNNSKEKTEPDGSIKLTEICFVKDPDGKKMIAKYQNDKKLDDEKLIVAWDASNSNAQVFSQKSRVPGGFLASTSSQKRTFRVHNFQKAAPANPSYKVKRNIYKKINAGDGKIKKTKILKKKQKERNKKDHT
ncbi:PREDICTED: cytosolic carboxypeptidase-like protein 5 [Nicrophorus vespilloides]|uniref:tubulin-glutamate carboxypeptidase n=1 Tax=Nicrophorus vespilloides TaxID=110193 RepID=A0ABM1M386_NICVS|nr:PREDICTED: cytosolic carboxypeptidase-like protein 5 [Nicrophorus vespilloides]XP_017769036.1 PREDICTED: cytosolic carboxypeptidase-like protein 5 [Nicrophorus vespilloides]